MGRPRIKMDKPVIGKDPKASNKITIALSRRTGNKEGKMGTEDLPTLVEGVSISTQLPESATQEVNRALGELMPVKKNLPRRIEPEDPFPTLDKRTYHGRKLTDAYHEIVSDLGGSADVSYMQKATAKMVASLTTIQEEFAVMKATDDPRYDLLQHIVAARTAISAMKALGLKRVVIDAKIAEPANPFEFLEQKKKFEEGND